MLGSLERHLSVTRADVLQRNEVAQATPSIWPAMGWLTSGFGVALGSVHRPARLRTPASTSPATPAIPSTPPPTAASPPRLGPATTATSSSSSTPFGLTTRYGHLSKIAVAAGAEVKRGDVLGYVGSTGRSTSSHLHYEVWANGRPVNPLRLLVGRPE